MSAYHDEAAAEIFAGFIGDFEFKRPSVPVVLNETGCPETDPETIRASLAGQLVRPVLWQRSIERMIADGAVAFVEVGPGRVLTKLNERIVPEAASFSTDDQERLEEAIRFMSRSEEPARR